MKWTELVTRVAALTGQPRDQVKETLDALAPVVLEALNDGEEVTLRNLCTIQLRWQDARQLRSVADHRRIMLDGRWTPKLRASLPLREAALARSPQRWRDPRQQSAWRLAETLIGDLDLYHSTRAPALPKDAPLEQVASACADAFGPAWDRVLQTWNTQVEEEIRAEGDHLLRVARARWHVETH